MSERLVFALEGLKKHQVKLMTFEICDHFLHVRCFSQ